MGRPAMYLPTSMTHLQIQFNFYTVIWSASNNIGSRIKQSFTVNNVFYAALPQQYLM